MPGEVSRSYSGPGDEYRVGVFAHPGKRRTKYLAYLRDYNPAWPGCCEHAVRAFSGVDAKRLAIEMHTSGFVPACAEKDAEALRACAPSATGGRGDG